MLTNPPKHNASDDDTNQSGTYCHFARLVLIVAAIGLGTVTLAAAIYQGANIFLFTFAGIVLGAGLYGLAGWVRKRTGLGSNWSLALVTTGIALILVLMGWLLGAQISKQLDTMTTALPKATGAITEKLNQTALGQKVLELGRVHANGGGGGGIFQRVTGFFSLGLSAIGHTLLVVFLGIYLAASPRTYRKGVLHLIPKAGRPRADEIMKVLGVTLQNWLGAQLLSMAIVGVLTTIGLYLLRVELALTLGILAFLLSFVPNFGPIVSAIPAVLIASIDDPTKAIWVVVLYIGVQTVESYVITPQIQKRAVEIPPALLLVAQVLMGVLAGIPGLIMATPLLACVLAGVKMLYVQDALNDPVEVKAEEEV